MIWTLFFAALCFLVAFLLTIFILLELLRQERNKGCQLKKTLEIAYILIVRHHAAHVVQDWGSYCKVCHRADGTEPEIDEIAKALRL